MKRVVFTGGPSSGKTTIIGGLKKRFGEGVIWVPETASLLIQGGYPKPGDSLPWSEEWHLLFEDAIYGLQMSIENANNLLATYNKATLIMIDRGLLDVAGHLPGGVAQYCQRYKTTENQALERYDVVIHLVSFVMFDPMAYERIAESRWGKSYFTSVEYARRIESATLDAWANHKNRFIVGGNGNIEQKALEVIDIIERASV